MNQSCYTLMEKKNIKVIIPKEITHNINIQVPKTVMLALCSLSPWKQPSKRAVESFDITISMEMHTFVVRSDLLLPCILSALDDQGGGMGHVNVVSYDVSYEHSSYENVYNPTFSYDLTCMFLYSFLHWSGTHRWYRPSDRAGTAGKALFTLLEQSHSCDTVPIV